MTGIGATEEVPGITQSIDCQQNFQVIVDSARTPDSLSRLLRDVKLCKPRRIISIFGCNGDVDPSSRPYMGEVAHYRVSLLSPHNLVTH